GGGLPRRDDTRTAAGTGRDGDSLGRISSAHRHDSAVALLARQLRDRVDRAAGLERAGALEILGLEIRDRPYALGQRSARKEWCAMEDRGDDVASAADIGEGDGDSR